MQKRAIHLIPELSMYPQIEKIRATFDPLYGKISPHITLVFPFESSISNNELICWIERAIINASTFSIQLKGPTIMEDSGYIFLLVEEGKEKVIQLHDKLYQTKLSSFLLTEFPYLPHVTVGQLYSEKKYQETVKQLDMPNFNIFTKIDTIILEQIEEDETSKCLKKFILRDK